MFSRFLVRAAPVLRRSMATMARSLSASTKSKVVTLGLASGAILTASTGFVFAEKHDYQAVKDAIVDVINDADYEYGSKGPLFVRLAWHAAGTYDAATKTGGSNGATMRFSPEKNWGANAGLGIARDTLEKVKKQFPWISYADLWILAGCVAIEEMGGPSTAVTFRAGRSDYVDGSKIVPDGRLPDASKDHSEYHRVFYRMGFNDQEIVALMAAHSLGRCHTNRSGFDGPWTRAPTTLSNEYFRLLLEEKWTEKKWNGPKQYENVNSGKDLMMLPSDLALVQHPAFKKWVEAYAKDEQMMMEHFGKAWKKLVEAGVPF